MLRDAIQQLRNEHKTFTHVLNVYGIADSVEGIAITKAISDVEYNLQKIEKPVAEEELAKEAKATTKKAKA